MSTRRASSLTLAGIVAACVVGGAAWVILLAFIADYVEVFP
jgi:hypothetical protein